MCSIAVVASFLEAALEPSYDGALWLSEDIHLPFVYFEANVIEAFANKIDLGHLVQLLVNSLPLHKLERSKVLKNVRHEIGVLQVAEGVVLVR